MFEAALNCPLTFTLVVFRLSGMMLFAPLFGSARVPSTPWRSSLQRELQSLAPPKRPPRIYTRTRHTGTLSQRRVSPPPYNLRESEYI